MPKPHSVSASDQTLPVANQRTIWALSWPIILSNITVPLLGLVDTAILGHLDDSRPMAAVAIGAQLFTLLLWSFGFLRMGTTAVTAQAIGQSGVNRALFVLQQALWTVLPIGILCLTLALSLTPLLLPFFGDDLVVKSMAAEYLTVRFWGIPIVLLQYCFIGWFIGRGDTRIPMAMLIVANVLNALLDYLFVWHFDMGAAGVALGTLLADTGALLIAIYAAYRCGLRLPFSAPQLTLLKNMLVINSHLFVRTLCLLSVFALFTALGANQGSIVVASNAVLITLLLLISNALDGFAHAAESLTGRYLGAKKIEQVHTTLKLTALDTVLVAALMSIAFALGGDLLFTLLTDNPEVLPRLESMHLWLWLLPLTGAASYWLDGVMIGAQASKAMRNSMLAAAFFVFLPLATLPHWLSFMTEHLTSFHWVEWSENWQSSLLSNGSSNNVYLWVAFHLFLLARAVFLLPVFLTLWRNPQKFSAIDW